ncbi:MAG TPA: DUF3395 domain-containing protein [Candidatus Dormibacteraeota bacterium]|nr:DUF3395 domain-containing protein [Candidatus Dormibacteraeota bacterium]
MKRVVALLSVLAFLAVGLSAQSGRWRLVRAEYGAGNAWMDVTGRVRSLINAGKLNIRADNATLGGDPAVGARKTLRLRVRDDAGHERMLTFREKEIVELSLSAGEQERDHDRDRDRDRGRLRITRASYGSGGRALDVTDLLNSRIEGDRLSLPINNNTMGGDPAYETRKTLTVWYSYDGSDLRTSVDEGGTLNIAPGGESSRGESFRNESPRIESPRDERSLQILRADYGADNRFADVTSLLSSRIRDGRLSLPVNNDTMGGDPADEHRKTLSVWYLEDGRPANVVVNEGGYLNLPAERDQFSGNLRIMRAQYGADFRYVDVTDRLNALIQGDQLRLRVNNDSMGGDPATDRHKELTVVYIFNGQQFRTRVNEKDVLNIPGANDRAADFSAEPLRILRATYGFGDQRVDVTARVGAMVNGDHLQFQVSNASLGGDPAIGQHKRLRVVYLWHGIRYETSAPEHGTLAIP